ncbi:MAG: hypothetical protein K0S61_438 [Anaerocolumna sp.]|nr:hypothetical protein [Anaerocolumna sp.]
MRRLMTIFLVEGIFCIVLAVTLFFAAGVDNGMYLLTLPFDIFGKVLRTLSLSSKVGNLAALLIFGVLSFIPSFYMSEKIKRSGFQKIDYLLPIISLYTIYFIYHVINPNLLLNILPKQIADDNFIPVAKMALAIIYYSLWVSYVVLRLQMKLTLNNVDNKPVRINILLQKILIFAAGVYIFIFSYFYTFQILIDFKQIDNQFTRLNTVFLTLKYLLEGIPIVFTVLIFSAGILLLRVMLTDHLKDKEGYTVGYLGLVSRQCIIATVFSNISLNLIQLLLSNYIKNTSYNLNISLIPLIIAFSASILAEYFKEAKVIHEDNEMFI